MLVLAVLYATAGGLLWGVGLLAKRLGVQGATDENRNVRVAFVATVVYMSVLCFVFGNMLFLDHDMLLLTISDPKWVQRIPLILLFGALNGCGGVLGTQALAWSAGNGSALISMVENGTYTVSSAVLIAIVFRERIHPLQFVAAGCILVAIFLAQSTREGRGASSMERLSSGSSSESEAHGVHNPVLESENNDDEATNVAANVTAANAATTTTTTTTTTALPTDPCPSLRAKTCSPISGSSPAASSHATRSPSALNNNNNKDDDKGTEKKKEFCTRERAASHASAGPCIVAAAAAVVVVEDTVPLRPEPTAVGFAAAAAAAAATAASKSKCKLEEGRRYPQIGSGGSPSCEGPAALSPAKTVPPIDEGRSWDGSNSERVPSEILLVIDGQEERNLDLSHAAEAQSEPEGRGERRRRRRAPPKSAGEGFWAGHQWMIFVAAALAGICWGGGPIGKKIGVAGSDGDQRQVWACCTLAVNAVPMTAVPLAKVFWAGREARQRSLRDRTFRRLLCLTFLLGLLSGLGSVLSTMAFAVAEGHGALVSVLENGVYTVSGALMISLLFREWLTKRQTLSAVLVVVGLLTSVLAK